MHFSSSTSKNLNQSWIKSALNWILHYKFLCIIFHWIVDQVCRFVSNHLRTDMHRVASTLLVILRPDSSSTTPIKPFRTVCSCLVFACNFWTTLECVNKNQPRVEGNDCIKLAPESEQIKWSKGLKTPWLHPSVWENECTPTGWIWMKEIGRMEGRWRWRRKWGEEERQQIRWQTNTFDDVWLWSYIKHH